MSPAYHSNELDATTLVELDVTRYHGPVGESGRALEKPYLLTLGVRPSVHGYSGAYPQAHAVVDDFGNLHIVGGWA